MNAHLVLVMDLYQELNCLFPYYQSEQASSYLLRKILHFYQNYRLVVNKLLFYKIQFHNQNIYTYQYHHF